MPDKPSGQRNKKDERTLLVALLLSAPGPAIISYAAFASGSAAQMADFLRRTSELIATFVSWLMYHKLRKKPDMAAEHACRLERITNYTVAAAMCAAGIALILVGIYRLLSPVQSGKTVLGVIIAGLGLIFNFWFWQKYRAINRKQYDPVIAAQQRLYRGKFCVDICVVTALAVVTFAPGFPYAKYIDALGSIVVAGYLIYNSVDAFLKTHRSQTPCSPTDSAE